MFSTQSGISQIMNFNIELVSVTLNANDTEKLAQIDLQNLAVQLDTGKKQEFEAKVMSILSDSYLLWHRVP